MPRRLLLRLKHRLDRSPLPLADPVRLELERELVELLLEDARRDGRQSGGVRCA